MSYTWLCVFPCILYMQVFFGGGGVTLRIHDTRTFKRRRRDCVSWCVLCNSSGPQPTFHLTSVILHSLMGTECASFHSSQCLHLPFPPHSFPFPFSLSLLRFDIYRKVPKDLTQPTYTGAFSEYFFTPEWQNTSFWVFFCVCVE